MTSSPGSLCGTLNWGCSSPRERGGREGERRGKREREGKRQREGETGKERKERGEERTNPFISLSFPWRTSRVIIF